MKLTLRLARAILARWRQLVAARPAIVWRRRGGFFRTVVRSRLGWAESGRKKSKQ